MLTPDQKGSIAELAVVLHASRLGVAAYFPLTDGGRYDLILDIEGRLYRVQCKFATRYGDVIIVARADAPATAFFGGHTPQMRSISSRRIALT
jgi:hypothetical protein